MVSINKHINSESRIGIIYKGYCRLIVTLNFTIQTIYILIVT